MKTQISEGKLTIYKLKSDKLKILVWVEDLVVFFYPHRSMELLENLK